MVDGASEVRSLIHLKGIHGQLLDAVDCKSSGKGSTPGRGRVRTAPMSIVRVVPRNFAKVASIYGTVSTHNLCQSPSVVDCFTTKSS